MRVLATGFPHLTGINVEGCRLGRDQGFLSLTNSRTITGVGLSIDSFSQEQVEGIIGAVENVTWWTISDPRHQLDLEALRRLGYARHVTIQVADENRFTKTITRAPPGEIR